MGALTRRAFLALGASLVMANRADACEPSVDLLARLEALERAIGRRLTRTSVCRSAALNTRVGGSPDSEHLTGHAVDVLADTPQAKYEILKHALTFFPRVGVGRTHIHLGISPVHPKHVVWIETGRTT